MFIDNFSFKCEKWIFTLKTEEDNDWDCTKAKIQLILASELWKYYKTNFSPFLSQSVRRFVYVSIPGFWMPPPLRIAPGKLWPASSPAGSHHRWWSWCWEWSLLFCHSTRWALAMASPGVRTEHITNILHRILFVLLKSPILCQLSSCGLTMHMYWVIWSPWFTSNS